MYVNYSDLKKASCIQTSKFKQWPHVRTIASAFYRQILAESGVFFESIHYHETDKTSNKSEFKNNYFFIQFNKKFFINASPYFPITESSGIGIVQLPYGGISFVIHFPKSDLTSYKDGFFLHHIVDDPAQVTIKNFIRAYKFYFLSLHFTASCHGNTNKSLWMYIKYSSELLWKSWSYKSLDEKILTFINKVKVPMVHF